MPTEDGSEGDMDIMSAVKRVMDYSRLDYFSVLDLPCDVFQLMLKNSIVDEYRQTEEGRKYLEKCERLRQTTPDMDMLRKKFDF